MLERNKLGPAETIPPLVAVVGTIIWITIDGFTGESIAQSLTTLCTMFVILIPIYRHILKKPKDTHLEAGIRACQDIQKKHNLIICGPKYRKDDYSPDSQHPDHEYLFIQKAGSRNKAVLASISPFKKAILEISFSHTMMELLGISGEFSDNKKKLHEILLDYSNKHYYHLFIEKKMEKHETICIVLDFDMEKVTVKSFRTIVFDLLQHTIHTLKSMRQE
jgi:hypothetical protein